MSYLVDVPGRWANHIACIDLETSKVPAPAGFRIKNGEVLKRRWSIVFAGVANAGTIRLIDAPRESAMLSEIAYALFGADEVRYAATREFDEMICKGRFTNARRAHEDVPFFPAVPGAEKLNWRNVRTAYENVKVFYNRGEDRPSKGTEDALARGGEAAEVAVVHNLRDVVGLILTADPDDECEEWCARVMADYDFARNEVFGD